MARFSYTTGVDNDGTYIICRVDGLQITWGSGGYVQNSAGYNHMGINDEPFVSGARSWFEDYYFMEHCLESVTDGYNKIYPSTSQTVSTNVDYCEMWFRLSSSRYVYPYLGMNNISALMWGVTQDASVSSGVTHPGVWIDITAAVRPSMFYWADYGGEPSSSTSILWIPKASAWNGLRYNIAQLLAYKGLISNADSFYDAALPEVSSGTSITAAMYNQAAYYINYMLGAKYLADVTPKSTPMYMYYWYQMQQYLNGIA